MTNPDACAACDGQPVEIVIHGDGEQLLGELANVAPCPSCGLAPVVLVVPVEQLRVIHGRVGSGTDVAVLGLPWIYLPHPENVIADRIRRAGGEVQRL